MPTPTLNPRATACWRLRRGPVFIASCPLSRRATRFRRLPRGSRRGVCVTRRPPVAHGMLGLRLPGRGSLGSSDRRNTGGMRGSSVLFSELMVPELYQGFWQVLADGGFITEAATAAGTYRQKGRGWIRAVGGVRPRRGRDLRGRYLSFAEREEIALGRAAGESMRSIARRLGAARRRSRGQAPARPSTRRAPGAWRSNASTRPPPGPTRSPPAPRRTDNAPADHARGGAGPHRPP